nr:MAG TPA: hypothetical protein [Caudoviricetes sp.]
MFSPLCQVAVRKQCITSTRACQIAMRLSWCWVQAKAANAETAPRPVKANDTQKMTAPALGKPHQWTM